MANTAEPADPTVTNVTNLEISRSMEPDKEKLPLEELKEYKLWDDEGNGYWFGDMHKSKKAIFIFIRHFLCFTAKEYVEDLALIPKKYLDEANVRIVVIGCGPWKYIKPFREATGYHGFLFVDPSRELYKKFKFHESVKITEGEKPVKPSRHVKSNFFMGTFKALFRGIRYHEQQGDYHQLGGSIIVGPGPTPHHMHRDRRPADHAPINDLLGMAAVQQVNFPGDTRVMTI